jgi:dethiobiotin synthetase
VGKTVVACAIAAAFAGRGARVGVMKPVETGIEDRDAPSDASALASAAGCGVDMQFIRPYALRQPVAPLVAARTEGVQIEPSLLEAGLREIARHHEPVVVEGAGGLLVPITPSLDFAALFAMFSARLVVVARNRLGTLNHTLLTLRAAAAAGLEVVAVVVHDEVPRPADEASRSNVSILAELAAPVRVFHLPWVANVEDSDLLVGEAERSGLIDYLFSMLTSVAAGRTELSGIK